MLLASFLANQLARPFAWGADDCALLMANWLVVNGHDDPAADLRGTYGTEDECRAVVARHGGLVPLVTLCAERAGLQAVAEPEFGAVGVIGAAVRRDRQWGAIFDGRKWVVRWTNEFVRFSARPLCMWRVIE